MVAVLARPRASAWIAARPRERTDGSSPERSPVLPDVPIKKRGEDEERYLFAQLLAAAPNVTVSWTECDDDGKATPASQMA